MHICLNANKIVEKQYKTKDVFLAQPICFNHDSAIKIKKSFNFSCQQLEKNSK